MALEESAVEGLLDALRVGEGTDLVRTLAEWALQQLIDTEAAQRIGADRYERVESRVTHRNGSRPRTLTTMAGDLELAISKLRRGSVFPEILEPRRRIDQALYAVVMEAYVHGASSERHQCGPTRNDADQQTFTTPLARKRPDSPGSGVKKAPTPVLLSDRRGPAHSPVRGIMCA